MLSDRDVLQPRLADAERMGLPYVAAMIRQNLALAVARLGDLRAGVEIERQSVSALAAQGARRMEGGSRTYLARMLLEAGDVAGSVREASEAANRLSVAPSLRTYALSVLALAQVASGALAEARVATDEIHSWLREQTQIEEGESLMRYAVARVLHECGDLAAARNEIRTARDVILSRSARLRSDEIRHAYLERVVENADTLALAHTLLDAGG